MNKHCPEKDILKLMHEWPLSEFLNLQEVVEMATALEVASHKDEEAKRDKK